MGSVDGNRIWGKEIKGMVLTHVQWSPDSKTILFGNSKGEVHIYDSHGTYNVSCTCSVSLTLCPVSYTHLTLPTNREV